MGCVQPRDWQAILWDERCLCVEIGCLRLELRLLGELDRFKAHRD